MGCLEGGRVGKQELLAWRGMACSNYQIHVHPKKQWAANFYSPAQCANVVGGVVEAAAEHVHVPPQPNPWGYLLRTCSTAASITPPTTSTTPHTARGC